MREGFISATVEALQQFLVPCTLCDELVVKGDDCPSWRGSLVEKFNIWLNERDKKSIVPNLKLLIPTRNKKKTSKTTTIERPRTEQLLFFLPVGIHLSPISDLFSTTQIFQVSLHRSRPYENSPT